MFMTKIKDQIKKEVSKLTLEEIERVTENLKDLLLIAN